MNTYVIDKIRLTSFLQRLCFSLLATIFAATAAPVSAAIPPLYEDALRDAAYEVFSGDINGDSRPDLLLKAKNQFVLIDYEIVFPVLLRWRNTFLVRSKSDGSYEIIVGPDANVIANPVWQSGTHELIFGDTDGDGSLELLVRALTPGGFSILLTTTAANGFPAIRQYLNYADIGIDLGRVGLIVALIQANNDGRADLMTSMGGVLEDTLFASASGSFMPSTSGGGSTGPVVVGSTTGAFQVSSAGAASYRVPLSLPPGVGGMTPQLAIEYSSFGPDSTMGLGFGISGLSQIARCPSTIAVDGVADPVDFDSLDRYCLDGQRLVTGGTYGAVGATYSTEMESFSRIKSVAGTSLGPDSWTVETKSGLKMTYGGTGAMWTSANGTHVWLLKQTQDSVGNAIDYIYTVDANSYRISEIRYGGNGSVGTPSNLRVKFQYSLRNGYVPGGYMYGAWFMHNYILSSVESATNDGATTVRSWNFTYHGPAEASNPNPPGTHPPPCVPRSPCINPNRAAAGASTSGSAAVVGAKTDAMNRYALTSVQECAGKGSTVGTACLPSTIFTWAPAVGASSGVIVNPSLGRYTDESRQTPADVNGDGYADLVNVFMFDGDLGISVFPKGGQGTASVGSAQYGLPRGESRWTTGDFNGDGMADIAFQYDVAGCGNPLYFRAAQSDYRFAASVGGAMDPRIGTCTDGPPDQCPSCRPGSVAAASSTYPDVTDMLSGDIDGNGRDDILLISNTSSGLKFRQVYSTGSGWQPGSTWYAPGTSENLSAFGAYAGDFDGNGKMDVILLRSDGNGVSARLCLESVNCANYNLGTILTADVSQNAPIIGDANGDGYADLTFVRISGSTAYHYTLLSTGKGAFSSAFSSTLALPASGTWRPAGGDYDGDGIIDIAWFEQTSAHDVVLMAGTGNGRFQKSETLSGVLSGVPSNYVLYPGDYDGDGKTDLAVFSRDSNDYAALRMAEFQGAANLRVGTITSGLGAGVELEYQPLTSGVVYSEGSGIATGFPVRRLNVPQYVVSRHRSQAPDLASRSSVYRYSGARLHVQGRGPLGFGRFEVQDEQTGIVESTSYRQDYPYIGLSSRVERRIVSSGKLISTADNTYLDLTVARGGRFAFANRSVARQYGVTPGYEGLVTTTVSTYDYNYSDYATYGNLRASTVKIYSGDEGASSPFSTSTINTFENYVAGGWFISRLKRVDVTRTNPDGETQTRSSAFDYDTATGLLSAEIVEPDRSGTYLYAKTDYTRDGIGNITVTKVSAYVPGTSGPTLSSRQSTSSFSAGAPYYRRFSTGSCNALNHCGSRSVDAATGNPTSATDANGLFTSFSYDDFGRSTGSSFIQGGKYLVSQTNRQWCADRADQCFGEPTGLYAVQSVASTGADSVVVYDRYEREVRRASRAANSAWLYTQTRYDALGRVSQVSMPRYSSSGQSFWATTRYDVIGRPIEVKSPSGQSDPTGRVVKNSFRGLTTEVVDARNAATIRVVNAMGKVVSVTNANNETLTYNYDAYDNLERTTDPAGNAVVISYDLRGRKITMDDPDMGAWRYAYNGFGELFSQTDAKAQTVKLKYDVLGRMIQRDEPEGRTVWTFDTLRKGALTSVRQTDTANANAELYKKTVAYDGIGNLQRETLSISGIVQPSTAFSYDEKNRIDLLTYPSGLVLKHLYNTQGALTELRRDSASGERYWRAETWDEWGKVSESTLGNGIVTAVYRDPAVGQTELIQSGPGGSATIQNWRYEWDANGNATRRQNFVSGLAYTETTSYDSLNRMYDSTTAAGEGTVTANTRYDTLGNIQSQNGIGTYTYAPGQPHAVTGTTAGGRVYAYDENGNMSYGDGAAGRRNYTWASFNLPTQVTQGTAWTNFTYGPAREKLRQTSYSQGLSNRSITYLNATSEKHTTATGDEYREHIVAPSGVVAQVSSYPSSGARNVLYVHRDRLGSIDAMTNPSGQNLALVSTSPGFGFDRWGKRRDDDGYGNASSLKFPTAKGYTGHEMLDTVGLIHMGGRVYDPTIGRFLSPDPFIQDPNNLQSYNRYSYAWNNPMSGTDPTGFWFGNDLVDGVTDFFQDNWRTIAVVAISIATYGAASAALWGINGYAWAAAGGFAAGMVGSGGDLRAGLIGAASAAAFFGISQGFDSMRPVVGHTKNGAEILGGLNTSDTLTKIVISGHVGGVTAEAMGGDYGSGFLFAGAGSGAQELYANFVGWKANPEPGEDFGFINEETGLPTNNFVDQPNGAGQYELPIQAHDGNVFGFNKPLTSGYWENFGRQSGPLSHVMNKIPGMNAVAQFHDTLYLHGPVANYWNSFTNFATMPPAALITYAALVPPTAISTAIFSQARQSSDTRVAARNGGAFAWQGAAACQYLRAGNEKCQ